MKVSIQYYSSVAQKQMIVWYAIDMIQINGP